MDENNLIDENITKAKALLPLLKHLNLDKEHHDFLVDLVEDYLEQAQFSKWLTNYLKSATIDPEKQKQAREDAKIARRIKKYKPSKNKPV